MTPIMHLIRSGQKEYIMKPWIIGYIRTELKARAAAFKERDTNPDAYKEIPKYPQTNHQTGKVSIQD